MRGINEGGGIINRSVHWSGLYLLLERPGEVHADGIEPERQWVGGCWVVVGVVEWLLSCLGGWLIVEWFFGWLSGWLVARMVGWLLAGVVGCWGGCWGGYLYGWLVGWVVGRLFH